jgi:uncharacterized cupredoxin-like copper-binding protein
MRPRRLTLLVPALAVAIPGCGGYGGDSGVPGPNEVVMTDYRFDPRDARVKPGTDLSTRNDGQVAHDLTLERRGSDQRLIGTDPLLSGDRAELTVDLPPGRYKMVCTVPGHEQRGMVGTLVVE